MMEVKNIPPIRWQIVVLRYALKKMGKANCQSSFQVNNLVLLRNKYISRYTNLRVPGRNHPPISMKAFLAEIRSCDFFFGATTCISLQKHVACVSKFSVSGFTFGVVSP